MTDDQDNQMVQSVPINDERRDSKGKRIGKRAVTSKRNVKAATEAVRGKGKLKAQSQEWDIADSSDEDGSDSDDRTLGELTLSRNVKQKPKREPSNELAIRMNRLEDVTTQLIEMQKKSHKKQQKAPSQKIVLLNPNNQQQHASSKVLTASERNNAMIDMLRKNIIS